MGDKERRDDHPLGAQPITYLLWDVVAATLLPRRPVVGVMFPLLARLDWKVMVQVWVLVATLLQGHLDVVTAQEELPGRAIHLCLGAAGTQGTRETSSGLLKGVGM